MTTNKTPKTPKAKAKVETKVEEITQPAAPQPIDQVPIPVTVRLGKSSIAVLTALEKYGPMTRPELTQATGIKSGFVSLLGPITNIPPEPSSLVYKGLIVNKYVPGKTSSVSEITDLGRATLKAALTPVVVAPAK